MMNKTFPSSLRKPFFWTSLLVLLALVLAACAPAAATQPAAAPTVAMPEATATTAATTAAMPEGEAEVAVVEDPNFGPILVDGKGMTLYAFTKDTPNTSNCAGGCLEAWPPLLSQGSPVAGEGVDAALLGTADMPDGSKIVTYNQMPLYYWAQDAQPGDTTGQNVNEVWFVVAPSGEMVTTAGQVPATGSGTETPAPTSDAAAATGLALNVATHPSLGEFLVDGEGMTLYMFKKDEADKSNCAGGCLEAWPPFVADDANAVTAGDGVDQSMIGTTDLDDGRMIVTYNHMPLYYWAQDTKPGDVTGQDVNDVWYVVAPDGTVIESEAPSSSSMPAEGDVLVNVAEDAKLGQILVDSKGMTLYMFTKDEPDKVNCAGGCLTAWPPFLTEDASAVTAGEGVDQAMLGTTDLGDGRLIVTYNHMPLYYWAGDTKAGDTTGQDVNKVWYVVAPDGKPVGVSSSTEY